LKEHICDAAGSHDMKIQLITINTWKCDGEYYKRMHTLADQLKKLTPHIIACQECFLAKDETVDTLRFLAVELDMYYYFTLARLKERILNGKPVLSYSGLGVLSAFRLELLEEFTLPTHDDDGERKVQQLEIKLSDNKKLLLTNVHLTHLHNATHLRKEQIELIAKKTALEGYAHNFVCGDFNAAAESEELGLFKSLTNAINCYDTGGGLQPPATMINESAECIDHIFSLPAIQADALLTRSGVVLDTPDPETGVYPSDHFGITTTFNT
jgi:endonuclease/exonuclease/phosphatase family metal-dependent hydrolase